MGPHVPNHYLSVTSMTFKSKVLVFSIFHYLNHRNLAFSLCCKSVLKLTSLSTRILFVIVTILANSLVDSCTSSKFSLFKSFKSKDPPDFHHDQRKRTWGYALGLNSFKTLLRPRGSYHYQLGPVIRLSIASPCRRFSAWLHLL